MQVPGKTSFQYYPFDALDILLSKTLKLNESRPARFDDFNSLYLAFHSDLETELKEIFNRYRSWLFSEPENENNPVFSDKIFTSSCVSIFEDDCIDRALDYNEGGTVYTVRSPHIGGAPDVGNSLFAIDRLCFTDRIITFDALMRALKDNWKGHDDLLLYVKNKLTYYGNDDDLSDSYTVRVLDDFAEIVHSLSDKRFIFIPGVSTFGRQVDWKDKRSASPEGSKRGDILSSNASPTPGTNLAGATAVIKSYCKANLKRQTNGAALDIKLFPTTVEGSDGLEGMKSLLIGFLNLGGYFMQTDVVDVNILRLAQKNPEDFKTLSVRVSGWNARFITLSDDWQRMIISSFLS